MVVQGFLQIEFNEVELSSDFVAGVREEVQFGEGTLVGRKPESEESGRLLLIQGGVQGPESGVCEVPVRSPR